MRGVVRFVPGVVVALVIAQGLLPSASGPGGTCLDPSSGSDPYVFYTVVTGCSNNRADVTYEADSDTTSQETVDAPWLDILPMASGGFYYVSAQKRSGDDYCSIRASIFTVNLTPEQYRNLPFGDFSKLITFLVDKARAVQVRTSASDGAFAVAEASWSPGQEHQ